MGERDFPIKSARYAALQILSSPKTRPPQASLRATVKSLESSLPTGQLYRATGPACACISSPSHDSDVSIPPSHNAMAIRLDAGIDWHIAYRAIKSFTEATTSSTKQQDTFCNHEQLALRYRRACVLDSGIVRPIKGPAAPLVHLWRISRSNGTTEDFHTRMEMISRRAFSFGSFENCCMRVLALCGWNGVINRV